MAFNITTKAISDTITFQLVDPATGVAMFADDAEKKPLTVEIFGKASKQYRNALSALSRKSLVRKGKAQSFEQNVIDNNELLAAISKEAKNFDFGDGVAINSEAQFLKLYSDASLYWIKDQASEALEGGNTSFLK